jgi:hypothetical protein
MRAAAIIGAKSIEINREGKIKKNLETQLPSEAGLVFKRRRPEASALLSTNSRFNLIP